MVVNQGFVNKVNRQMPMGNTPTKEKISDKGGSFENILKEKLNENTGVKFSKHAELRMQMRNIHLSETQKEKMNQAVKKAEDKGVKDSLVIVDDVAFVVNVKSKIVITAISSSELRDNVFTKIDGAIFA